MISFDVVPYTLQTDWKWVTECKYRSSSKFGDPLEAVNLHKQQKICHTAVNFCVKYGYVNYPCRFDVIAIYKDGTIKHIKNAFEYS